MMMIQPIDLIIKNIQRNKRSIAINLKQKDGLAILKQLVRTADIFIESFRPDCEVPSGN